jgi:eukaryotic-like serine/threonine-protein kinase
VTDTGNAMMAAMSPDGNYLLTLLNDKGLARLQLLNVPTNSVTQVQPPADVYYNGLRFSPDGNYFYFVRSDPGNPELKFLYRAPLLGGIAQKLASDVDTNITFSPDGKKYAFVRYDNPEPGKYRLIVRPIDGGDADENVLANGPNSESLSAPAWSPDGKTIICNRRIAVYAQDLVAIDVESGQSKPILSSQNLYFFSPVWMPDGNGLLGLVHEQKADLHQAQIGYLSYPEAKSWPITRDTNIYSDLSVAANGRALATILSEEHWNLFVLADTNAQPRSVATARQNSNFTWTPDGQLIDDQNDALNRIDPVTGIKTVVTQEVGTPTGDPSACPDDRFMAFEMLFHATAGLNIWRADSNGGNLKQLSQGKHDHYALCSPDSRWIYFIAQEDEGKLSRVSIDGGTSQTVSELPIEAGGFDVSPDGKFAAFATLEHSGEHKERLAIVSTDPGQPQKLVDFERVRLGFVRFSHDGKAVVYPTRENGVDNLWAQPLDGSKGHSLTNFTSEHIWDFRWSFDGKQLALVRGHTDSDVVLIRNSQ